ncbi:hypothetical protein O6H91_01G013600 [Diphasiastrum complanatum]|nr:hypothetical protein O6H91_01G013600 [Diphasiastrum complanatum]
MDCEDEDLELLLSLQTDFKVQETPPPSPSPTCLSDKKENNLCLKVEDMRHRYAAKLQRIMCPPSDAYPPEHGSFSKGKDEPLLGYCSHEDLPKPKSAINMASFKPFLKEVAMLPTKMDFSRQRTVPVSASSVDIDVFSGLKIKNRVVSTASLSSKFSDLRFIRLQAIKNAMIGDNVSGAWATVGVVAEKGNPRLSTNGKNFVVWKLTVLDGTLISVFLFGDAYSCHWKESAGSVIAVFNARVRRDVKRNEFSLSAFGGDQVLLLGTAADFGVCKGKRKDGNLCTLVINRRQGEFCKYHSAAYIQKYKTKRGELSGGNLATGFTGPSKIRHAQVIKSFEDTPVDKPVKRVKHLSSSDLAKALSNADKVTTRTSSQGIRFLTQVADETAAKLLETKITDENKGALTRKKKFQTERNVLTEKVLNTNLDATAREPVKRSKGQNKAGVLELDIEGSDDELEQALSLFRKSRAYRVHLLSAGVQQ